MAAVRSRSPRALLARLRAPTSIFAPFALGLAALACGGGTASDDSANDDSTSDDSANDDGVKVTPPGSVETDDSGGLIESDEDVLVGEEGTSGSECAREPHVAERVGVNLYLLLDVSGSMDGYVNPNLWDTFWDAVREAVVSFIRAPESAGIELALNYFPIMTERSACEETVGCPVGDETFACISKACTLQAIYYNMITPCLQDSDCTFRVQDENGDVYTERCTEPFQCSNDPERLCFADEQCGEGATCAEQAAPFCPGENECTPARYAEPAVARASLPDNAELFIASLSQYGPDSFAVTPTQAALGGVYSEVATWIAQDATTKSAVVLATDGQPFGCNDDAPDVATLRARSLEQTLSVMEGAAADGIDTFVIGVLPDITGDPDPIAAQASLDETAAQLDVMARAGGTDASFNVTIDDTDASSFLAALDAIRGQLLPCEYAIPTPSSGVVSFDRLNVELTAGGQTELVPQVASAAACTDAEPAWHYDADPTVTAPSRVVLCPATCEAANSAAGNQVDIVLGCQTVVLVR